MLDHDFLTHTVSTMAFLSEATPKQMITVKDLDSVIVFCSDYLSKLIGIPLSQLLGKKIWLSLYDNDMNFEKIIVDEDQGIIDSREPKLVLKINRFCQGLMPYLAIKTPIINPETNHVVGILFQGWEICTTALTAHLASTFQPDKKIENLSDRPKLSKREKEVIFFFMANLSSQEIAEMLYTIGGKPISKSTVDSIFNDQLYEKFDVYSRIALYKKLQSLGYDQLIPKELLSTKSIVLDIMKPY